MNDITAIKRRIYAACVADNADAADISMALAQILGEIAAQLDIHTGPIPFDDRFADIVHHAKVAHANFKIGIVKPVIQLPPGFIR